MADTPLTLAETASVFGELLTFRALLGRRRPTRCGAAIMLAGKIEDMLNTVVRQIAFCEFERRVHDARREAELTPDELGEIWLDVQTREPGPGLRLPTRTTGSTGPTSRTSSTRRSTSTPTRSATAW